MPELTCTVDSPQDIALAAQQLRTMSFEEPIAPRTVLDVFEKWSDALNANELREIPGLTFMRLWLRRNTLEPLLVRELGKEFLDGGWYEHGQAKLRPFPVGLVGHWPAGNIEILPVLSLTCALLGGNSSIVRVPITSEEVVRQIMEKLEEADRDNFLTRRIRLTFFDHESTGMQEAMARAVDGGMIWGGAEAVTSVRQLPFPPCARLAVFGPRLSVAAMDGSAWSDHQQRSTWCRRLARDVWQFDQQACSSPQALFLERRTGYSPAGFVADLKKAFEEENRAHPRRRIHPALTSTICLARASWLLKDYAHQAWFSESPDWTILLGDGVDVPRPTQGRTLSVLLVDDLLEVIARFDGTVQTLGLAMTDTRREQTLAEAAGFHGVDRVVKLGQMHTFSSPWDGADLVRPMVRLVRHLPSLSGDRL